MSIFHNSSTFSHENAHYIHISHTHLVDSDLPQPIVKKSLYN